jgi:hypothetical protein
MNFYPEVNRKRFWDVLNTEKISCFMIHEVQLAAHVLNPKISNTKTFIIDYAQPIGLDKNKILQDLGEYCGKQSLLDDPKLE